MASNDPDFRLETDGGLPYRLKEGYPILGEDQESVWAEECYIMRASDVVAFMRESFPAPALLFDVPTIFSRRTMPGANYLRTTKVTVSPFEAGKPADPFGADNGSSAGTYSNLCEVMIEYETGTDESTDFLEKTVNAGAEFLHIPPEQIELSQNPEFMDPANDPNNPANPAFDPNRDKQLGIYKRIPTIEWSYRWKYVFAPRWSTFVDKLGKVNDRLTALFPQGLAETVMFTGFSGSQVFRWYGNATIADTWSLDFKFSQRVIKENDKVYGWNHVYVPNKGAWRKLKRKDDPQNPGPVKYLYETTDLNDIFRRG